MKSGYVKTALSSEVLQVLPALNYAELEIEKCPPKQNEEVRGILERHLQNFATLICPGLTSSPSREASMFPDQYDVPNGFPLIAPKWTEQTGDRLKTYLKGPCSFQIPVSKALELLSAGKQQRSDDHEDDVFYYISSPEAPRTPAEMVVEKDMTTERDQLTCRNVSDEVKKTAEEQTETEKSVTVELPHCTATEEVNTPGAAVAADKPVERTDPSAKSGDLPTEHYAQTIHADNTAQDSKKSSEGVSVDDKCSRVEFSGTVPTSVASSPTGIGDNASPQSNKEMAVDLPKNVDCLSNELPEAGGQIPVAGKIPQKADLPKSISPPTTALTQTEDCKYVKPEANSAVIAETNSVPKRRGKRRRRKGLKRNTNKVSQTPAPLQNTTISSCPSTEATSEQSNNSDTIQSSPSSPKIDWRSLPRRKRHWNADACVRRTLRSGLKNAEMPYGKNSETEKNAEHPITENIIPCTPKRKMEGVNMRERYGLKTIITDCGFVFVPHGSEVAPGDIKANENKQVQDSPIVPANSPLGEEPTTTPARDAHRTSEIESRGPHMPLTHVQNSSSNPAMGLSSEQSSVPESTEKNKSTKKGHVYKAISISKLKTVLKRAKRTKSPGAQDHGKSVSGNTEPELKRGKTSSDVELSDNGNLTLHAEAKKGNQKHISKILKENGRNVHQ